MQWKSGSSPAEAMLQHWSTYGKEQPAIADLIKFLKIAGLVRAVTDVKKDLLKSNFFLINIKSHEIMQVIFMFFFSHILLAL